MPDRFDHTQAFLAGGGEMGERMRTYDWAATPLGPPDTWPEALRTIASVILNSPLLGTVLWGPELRMLYNDAYAPALAERHPSALGRPIAEVWGTVWRTLAPAFLRVRETGEPIFEPRYPLSMVRDGREELTYWNYSVAPIRDGTGQVVGLLNHAIEITGQVLAEERQAEAERLLQAQNTDLQREVSDRTLERDRLWETTNDLMGTASVDGFMRSINPAWTRLLGWSQDELLHMPFSAYIHPDDHAAADEVVARIVAGETVTSFIDRLRTRDGAERTVMWTSTPDPQAGEGLFHVVGRDVTDRLQAEEQLRQSQKMEAVGQLTGGVAHDFNNLLTVIRSSTDLLKRADLSPERHARYIAAISDTVDRAAKLTAQLLAFARRQTLKPVVFSACDSVRALTDMMRTLTGSRVQIVTALSADPCFVNADPSQFDTALVNLAVNARDAMDGDGRITVTVEPAEEMPALRSHARQEGAYVAVSLTDIGSGIPADVLSRIFEPFFTTKETGKGTGLGLSQVFGFAKQSGGDVSVASQVGEGTTFTFYLPRVPAPEQPEAVDAPEELADGHGMRVLVVEDNIDVGTFTVQSLSDLGYITVLAEDGPAALAELAKGTVQFDAVFSDVVMPGMSGIELGQEIRRLYRDLPVVLTSGYSHVLAQNGSYGLELLNKPYSIEQLSQMLRKVASWQRRKRLLQR